MKNKYFTMAIAARIMASCSNNDIPVDETKDTPITIASASVA